MVTSDTPRNKKVVENRVYQEICPFQGYILEKFTIPALNPIKGLNTRVIFDWQIFIVG
ncbi:MAG: hypothetical protein MUC66_02860 [Methanolinea sp.]|jgi:hypothetical protein|nr:hypothetical protein [Methanolinea sp.]